MKAFAEGCDAAVFVPKVAAISQGLGILEAALKSSSALRIISLRCFSNISDPSASMSSRS
jgi:hypothetical protein